MVLRNLISFVLIFIITELLPPLRHFVISAANISHRIVSLIINDLLLIVPIEEDVYFLELLDHLRLYSFIHLKARKELINLVAVDTPRLVEHDEVLALGAVVDINEVLLVVHLYLLQLFEGVHLNRRERLLLDFLRALAL